MHNIIYKRDGSKVDFDKGKIIQAVLNAFVEVDDEVTQQATDIATNTANIITEQIEQVDIPVNVEKIQNEVEHLLMFTVRKDVAQSYIRYRYKKELVRRGNTTDKSIKELLDGNSEYWMRENSNKNARLVTTQRDYLAGITSTDIARRFLLPKDVCEAHDKGAIHFHDMDYMAQNTLTNCCLINLDDMLQSGTVINDVMIEKPHKLLTAVTVATQIILSVTSSQYGGTTITLSHLAPFVRDSYNTYYNKYRDWGFKKRKAARYAIADLEKEIEAAVQTFNYQVNSMSGSNGQSPFITVFMYVNETKEYRKETAMLIEEFLKQRMQGFKNSQGVYVTPAFPKLIYVLSENNISEGSEYYYLTELSAQCTAKRMVPDYISEKKMLQMKINKSGAGDCYGAMGCRSFLTPDRIIGNPAKALNYNADAGKYYGRFNIGVATLNLPFIALEAKRENLPFFDVLSKYAEICHRGLQTRIKRLDNTTADVAPIMWQYGALARLDADEKIGTLLRGGYATASLGYAGLYECVKIYTGSSHMDDGYDFGIEVMQQLNAFCDKWKGEEDIDYSIYGTPIENTTYKFANSLKEEFGEVDGVTDRNYITNSYHCPVFSNIDAFTKLSKESDFQKLSPGGMISYIEMPNMSHNIPAILEVIKHIYNAIMYAELNTKSDYCHKCKYDGEIMIVEDDGRLVWECPNCGNRDQKKMSVARRTCGYIGTNFWNEGRTEEIKERVLHLDDHMWGDK